MLYKGSSKTKVKLCTTPLMGVVLHTSEGILLNFGEQNFNFDLKIWLSFAE